MRITAAAAVAVVFIVCSSCRSSGYYLEKADRLFSEGKYADAVLLYRKAIQKDSKDAAAYYKLGRAQRATTQNLAAYESFLRAVALKPDYDEAQIELADLYLGDYLTERVKVNAVYEKIAEIADHLLAKDPKSYAGLRFRGYLATTDKKPEEAISYFTQANQVRPMQADVVLGLTQALLMAGRYEEARRTALNFIENNKSFGPVYDVLYSFELTTGHTADAESLIKLKVANNPANRDFILQLAQHYWQTGRPDEAHKLLDPMLAGRKTPSQTYIAIGDFYRRNTDWQRALATLTAGLDAHPEDRQVFEIAKADVLALQGKTSEAIRVLNDVIQEKPADLNARKSRAMLLMVINDLPSNELALKELQSLVQTAPNDLEVMFHLGRAYAANEMREKARLQFEAVLKHDEANVPTLLALAELMSTSKQFQQSLQYSERVLTLSPGLRNARLLHATSLVGLGQLDRARNEYKSLLSDEPAYTEAKLQFALLNIAQKRFSDGEKMFRDAYQPGAGDFRALKGLVEVYASQGQTERAIHVITAELGRFPDSIPVRRILALTAVRAGKVDLAIQQYEYILQRQAGDLESWTQLGELYQRTKNLAKSISALEKARDLAPNDWRSVARLAVVQQQAGLFSEAKRNYTVAIQIGADAPDLFNNLAYLEAEAGSNLDSALALAQKALAKAPNNSQYADTMGYVYLKRKDTGSALQVFRRLSGRYPNDAGFRVHLAMALVQNGQPAEAQREIRVAIARNPSVVDDPNAKRLLEDQRD